MFTFPRVSPQRAREIVREIAKSSRMRGRFFVLLIAASMIASFGLIANSTAVIIGAMLVSPLMTPIFGVALGMLRGNPRLLLRALTSETLGVILAVASAYLVGFMGLAHWTMGDATPEMLARTQPNLLDLLVAIFAGFAGAYALIDERVSPALPGVAIATAIVPPLSTCGLCLALGAWSGAGGAMLLFLANFVSILIVGLAIFWAGGLAPKQPRSLRNIVGHFGPAVVAFAAVTVILTNSLFRIIKDRQTEYGIRSTLQEQLALAPSADLQDVVYRATPQGIQIMAVVRSQRTISPSWVSSIEEAIEETIDSEVDLVVRTLRSRDVSRVGKSLRAVRPNLNGTFLVEANEGFAAREAIATQVIREMFETEPAFELTRVEYGISPDDEGIIVAYINAIRRLGQIEVRELQQRLRGRLQDDSLRLFVRVDAASLQDQKGHVPVEWVNRRTAGPANIEEMYEIEQAIPLAVKQTMDLEPLDVHFNWQDGRWRALVEVVGAGSVSTSDIRRINEALPQRFREKVEVLVWRRTDCITTLDGYTTYERLTAPNLQNRAEQLHELFRTDVAAGQQLPPQALESLASD